MVAGDRRRPATSNAAETVMGSPPNRTADRARGSTSAGERRRSPVGDRASRFAQAMRKPAAYRPSARPSSAASVHGCANRDARIHEWRKSRGAWTPAPHFGHLAWSRAWPGDGPEAKPAQAYG